VGQTSEPMFGTSKGMRNCILKNEPLTAQSARAPAARGKGAYAHLISNHKPALVGLMLIFYSIFASPVLAQTERSGNFENLPVLQSTNAVNGTLADVDALNGKLDDAIAKSGAAIDAYAQAINDAAANFTAASSNHVEDCEMEALRVAAEGLRLFTANGPRALELHAQISAKGDRVASILGTRIATRVKAAKQLAEARNVPIELVEVELSPAEMGTLKEWSVVSDEVRFTEAGTRLHVDRLEQIMVGVGHDRARLAQEGASLTESVKRMEMLQRVVKRFADDAIAEQRFKHDAIEFHNESERFGAVAERYRKFTRLGEQSIQPRSNAGTTVQNLQLGGPVQ